MFCNSNSRSCLLLAILLLSLFCSSATAYADIETMGVFDNDTFFDSDGSGVSGSLELAAKIDEWRTGVGLYVATPELLKEKRPNDDPLAEISRLNLWIGKRFFWLPEVETLLSGRIGLEGGKIDDLGFAMQDLAHEMIDKGSRDLESTTGTTGLIGVSGWVRTRWWDWASGNARFSLVPYGHASLGNDTVEGGCGLMLSVQPDYETDLPWIMLPKNGSYAPMFGGDGVGIYAGGRGIAHESLYGDLHESWIGEVGIFGQKTIYGSLKLGAGASCTTKPYEGAIGNDCKVDLRISYDWSTPNTLFDRGSHHDFDVRPASPYHLSSFRSDVATIPWQTTALVAGIGVLGVASWDWGSSSFNFNDEGFFGSDTGSLGMDKLGHGYSTYVISDFLTHSMRANGASASAPYNAPLFSWMLMLGVEIFDGFSDDHGFAYEDLIFNGLGAGFSLLRNTIPGMREKLDFRLEYIPSGNTDGFHPITDYSGQKYILALKLAGFDWCKQTPLQYVELHGGYFARGFTDYEKERGEPERKEPYVAVGLNISELLFGNTKIGKTNFGRHASRFLEYVQIPYTYIATAHD